MYLRKCGVERKFSPLGQVERDPGRTAVSCGLRPSTASLCADAPGVQQDGQVGAIDDAIGIQVQPG
jgi:hypothetical protein